MCVAVSVDIVVVIVVLVFVIVAIVFMFVISAVTVTNQSIFWSSCGRRCRVPLVRCCPYTLSMSSPPQLKVAALHSDLTRAGPMWAREGQTSDDVDELFARVREAWREAARAMRDDGYPAEAWIQVHAGAL